MIELKRVQFSYSNEDLVLNDINVEIEEGSFVSVVGQNGSGKSTFAKLLNALFLPSEGEVLVDGLSSSKEENIWEIRKKVGMVFQNPDNQMVATIVEEDVAFGPENLGVPREEIRKRIDQALSDVEMSKFSRKPPHQLSGGQKQRVAIAGILAMKPKYVIFDESTSMLDPKGKAEVMASIEKLHRAGMTIIQITHSMKEVLHSNRVLALKNGRIIADTTPRAFFLDDQVQKELDFELPLFVQISRTLRKENSTFPICFTEDELVEALCQL